MVRSRNSDGKRNEPAKIGHPRGTNKQITSPDSGRMAYVDLDLHKKTVQISVMDERGTEIFNASVQSDRKTLEASLRKMPPNAKYVLESSSVWWVTYRLMTEDMGLDVILSNPYRTKIIAESKKKTDKLTRASLQTCCGEDA